MKLVDKSICGKCKSKCCYFGGPSITKAEKKKILKAGFKDYFIPCHDMSGKVYPYKNYFDLKTCNAFSVSSANAFILNCTYTTIATSAARMIAKKADSICVKSANI